MYPSENQGDLIKNLVASRRSLLNVFASSPDIVLLFCFCLVFFERRFNIILLWSYTVVLLASAVATIAGIKQTGRNR